VYVRGGGWNRQREKERQTDRQSVCRKKQYICMFDNQFRITYTYSHVGIHEYMNSYKHLQSCFTRT
jgi:hypothetical protein